MPSLRPRPAPFARAPSTRHASAAESSPDETIANRAKMGELLPTDALQTGDELERRHASHGEQGGEHIGFERRTPGNDDRPTATDDGTRPLRPSDRQPAAADEDT